MYFPQKWPSIGHLDALLAKTVNIWLFKDPPTCMTIRPDVKELFCLSIPYDRLFAK